VRTETQLEVFIENIRGSLAQLAGKLAGAKVNIRAISVPESSGAAVVRMVVDDTSAAQAALEAAGIPYRQDKVLALPLEDLPGRLASATRKLAQARVDILYAYGSGGRDDSRTLIYRKVSDFKAARKALAG